MIYFSNLSRHRWRIYTVFQMFWKCIHIGLLSATCRFFPYNFMIISYIHIFICSYILSFHQPQQLQQARTHTPSCCIYPHGWHCTVTTATVPKLIELSEIRKTGYSQPPANFTCLPPLHLPPNLAKWAEVMVSQYVVSAVWPWKM